VEKRIQEDNLQHLALFAEYGRIAVAPKVDIVWLLFAAVAAALSLLLNVFILFLMPIIWQSDKESILPAETESAAAATESSQLVEEHSSKLTAALDVSKSNAIEKEDIVRTKPFQRLQFLVRDWPNFDADWDEEEAADLSVLKESDIDLGLENEEDDEDDELVMVGRQEEKRKTKGDGKDVVYSRLKKEMREYLREVIRDRGLGDLQSTREQISRCFGTVDCFLLPHPGLAVTKKNYSGSIPQIGSFFRGLVNRLVNSCHSLFSRHRL
jgi:hypothetical protein